MAKYALKINCALLQLRDRQQNQSACRHTNAGVTALCSPNSFITTKRMDARLTDINRPDGHQPTESGPAAVPPPLGQQVNVLCPRPNGRISRDSQAAQQESTRQGFFNSAPTPDQGLLKMNSRKLYRDTSEFMGYMKN